MNSCSNNWAELSAPFGQIKCKTSKLYDIKELMGVKFMITFKIIYHPQQEDTGLTKKLKCTTYKIGFLMKVKIIFNL